MKLKEHDDYISDMVCHDDKKNLLVTRYQYARVYTGCYSGLSNSR